MTQEQKDLLLKDLCARLSYGVKGRVSRSDCNNRKCEFVATIDGKLYDRFAVFQESWYDNVTIKPYLFPMSSMTEEQYYEMEKIVSDDYLENIQVTKEMREKVDFITHFPIYCPNVIDWFIKNHIDYRGLIPMGLAIDATGLNIY